jgi:hypothetical protein
MFLAVLRADLFKHLPPTIIINTDNIYGWLLVVMGGYGWLWVVMGDYGQFWVVMGGYGWLWVVMGGFGGLWVCSALLKVSLLMLSGACVAASV